MLSKRIYYNSVTHVLYVSGDDFIEHNLNGLRVQLIAMV